FLENETGARIGMVSTGPDREQTIFTEEFGDELKAAMNRKKQVRARS
ncbi:MAG: hypothetical protein JO266_13355, partial [Acidobacteria bacterium]|nr:hypothetical protein [Acidobacteriota bacterium]